MTVPIKYRISSVATKPTADSVKGVPLTSLEIDGNFRSIKDAIEDFSESTGSALVGYDGGTVQDVLDSAKPMANYTALRAYTGRATAVRITTPGIHGPFYYDASDTTTPDNGGTVIVGTDGRRWKRLFDGFEIFPEWFGATGGGVADDTEEFSLFLDALNNRRGFLAGKYRLTAQMLKALANCELVGIPGQTEIIADLPIPVIRFLSVSNVRIYGIGFANNTASISFGFNQIIYAENVSVKNLTIHTCKFTSPNSKTSSVWILPRTTNADLSTLDGLRIENCDFEDSGGVAAITVMNRNYLAADRYSACKNIYIENNRASNQGKSITTDGMLVSLDGVGSKFKISHNTVESCTYTGIENTGFIDGEISFNTSLDSTPLLSIDAGVSGVKISDVRIFGNTELVPTRRPSYFKNMRDCDVFGGNEFQSVSSYYPDDVSDCRFSDTRFKSTGINSVFESDSLSICDFEKVKFVGTNTAVASALFLNSATTAVDGNKFRDCLFDVSASTGVSNAVLCNGASVTNNRFFAGNTYKKGAGAGDLVAASSNGASNNWFEGFLQSFIPTVTGSTTAGAATYSSNRRCAYERTINRVDFSLFVELTGLGGMAGNVRVSIPLTARSADYGIDLTPMFFVAECTGVTVASDTNLYFELARSQSYMSLKKSVGGVVSYVQASELSASASFKTSGYYFLSNT